MSDRTPQGPTDPGSTPTPPSQHPAGDAAARAERAAAEAERSRAESYALAVAAREAAVEAAKKAGRFSREFLVTVISVFTTALGVVVALAWNTALSKALASLSERGEIVALFVYALLITLLAVLAIVVLARIARRMDAVPLEFKIEGKKE
jgi:hypothetical protein